jgi:hypothetical protein
VQEKLGALEKRLRAELEAFKQELLDEKSSGDARTELIRDMDTSTRTLRTRDQRRRKRLYGEGMSDDDEPEKAASSSGGGQAKKRYACRHLSSYSAQMKRHSL